MTDKAPDSPRIRAAYRKLTTWGCAPLFITGMIAGLVPSFAEKLVVVGPLGILAVGLPMVVRIWQMRRDNASRYRAAVEEARQTGGRVKHTETPEGDFEYTVVQPPKLEPIDWEAELGDTGEDPAGEPGEEPGEESSP